MSSADELEGLVDRALAAQAGRPGALLPVLHAIQDALGYIPAGSIDRVARGLNLSRADVHGVVTFYHDFRESPPGRVIIKLCRAEACQASGCEELVRQVSAQLKCAMGETRADGAVTLEPVYCLGNCALGPSAMINGKLMGRATADLLAQEAPLQPPPSAQNGAQPFLR